MSGKVLNVPKVTVCVVTYNQEQYIKQCLQSIVDQETEFEFEVIVSDDCSTDGTRKIIQQFADKYSCIKPLLRERNIGALENFIDTHSSATGKYICHMDGDDYWLPTKLQKQADFLDKNSECNLVWTRSLFEKGEVQLPDLINNKNFFTKNFYRGDIIRFISIGTNSSHMYRHKFSLNKLPNFGVVDYFKNVVIVNEGFASFVSNEPLTVYRIGVGISSSGTNIIHLILCSMQFFFESYPDQKSDLFSSSLLLSYSCLKRKKINFFIKFFTLSLKCLSVEALRKLTSSFEVYKMLRIPTFKNGNDKAVK